MQLDRNNFFKLISNYVKQDAPEPEILKVIGAQSKRNGTDKLTSQQIDRIIRASRADKKR
jgi:hypothetical protein